MSTSGAPTRLEDCGSFLTVAEAANVLRISVNGTYDLIREGALPAVRNGRRLTVPRVVIERKIADALAACDIGAGR
jgi:excisionase family DNA binding protein